MTPHQVAQNRFGVPWVPSQGSQTPRNRVESLGPNSPHPLHLLQMPPATAETQEVGLREGFTGKLELR